MSAPLVVRIRVDRETDRVLHSTRRLEPAMKKAVRAAWADLGRALKREASKEILRKPKSGRVYMVRGPSGRMRPHVASAPGETHANLSGALRRSIGWKIAGHSEMSFGYGVSREPAPRYASFVEFGTRRMEARPSLQNAINATQAEVERSFQESMRAALAEARR